MPYIGNGVYSEDSEIYDLCWAGFLVANFYVISGEVYIAILRLLLFID